MAKVRAFFPIRRTMCGITFYLVDGRNYARKKSSLSRRRVKYSAAFANTRIHAAILKQGSKIASMVYKCLPEGWRKFWMYRAFTGEAMQLLKAGMTKEEAIVALKRLYVEEIQKAVASVQPACRQEGYRVQDAGDEALLCRGAGAQRKYVKKDVAYWNSKTTKANKRKAKREKLQHYASLMAKASKIGSEIYKRLPAEQRKGWNYKDITGMAMRMLKENMTEERVVGIFLTAKAGSRQPVCRDSPADATVKNFPGKKIGYGYKRRMATLFCIPQPEGFSKKRSLLRRKLCGSFLSMPP